MNAVVKKARFAPHPHSRALIAKVKLASKQLGLDDDTYRSVLAQVTGQMSAADCSEAELAALVEHFKARGWKARPARKVGRRPAADHPVAKKARAMWISLYHLGAVDNSSEQALEAFARRQLKVDALQWADQSLGYRLVEALKAMAERHGWLQGGFPPHADASRKLLTLKRRLCEAILVKLKGEGFVPMRWELEDAAFRLCGFESDSGGAFSWDIQRFDAVAAALGCKLREDRP